MLIFNHYINSTIPQLIEGLSTEERPFLFYNGKRISYRELDEITDSIATSLLKMGFKRGDRLAVIALNQPEWLYAFFAANKIGVGIVALNVRYREAELEYMLNNSSAKRIDIPSELW